MLRAATWPWRSATTQCSTRMRVPVCGSGQRAMSPAAKMSGALVCRNAFTATPRSIVRPACSASAMARPHADAHGDEVGSQPLPGGERHAAGIDRGGGRAEVKDHAVLFVDGADHVAERRPHDAFQRPRLGRDDVHRQAAGPQRGGHFQADEAGADHDALPGGRGVGDQRPAVGQRAQDVDMRQVGAGNAEPDRIGSGGDQQRAIGQHAAVRQPQLLRGGLDRRDPHAELQADPLFGVEIERPQRNPIFRGGAGEVVFRQVGPVVRRRVIGAEQGHRPGVALLAQGFGGRVSRSTPADDDNRVRQVGRRRYRPGFGRQRLAHKHASVALFGLPSGQAVERRRPQRGRRCAG